MLVFSVKRFYCNFLTNCTKFYLKITTDHFTVVCSVTRPLNGSEAGGDLVLIQTSLLLFCKSSCSDANGLHLHEKSRGLYQCKVNSSLATFQRPAY